MGAVFARKRPVLVEAFRYDGTNGQEIADWAAGHATHNNFEGLVIDTPQGPLKANVGDVVIHGPNDEWYPVKAETYPLNFEEVDGA